MHDIIIAGCGLAGGYLNKLLPDSIDVMAIEKNRKIVPRDSGIVSRRFFNLFEGAERFIGHEICVMRINSPSRSFILSSGKPFAYVLKREKLLKQLRKNVKYETILGVKYHEDRVTIETNRGTHEAKMLIGCDGAASPARRCAGIGNPALFTGMMARTRRMQLDEINVFFNKFYSPDFFSWIIPQNKEYGLVTGIRPPDKMKYFRKSQKLDKGKQYSYPIPLGITKSYGNRLLLVGDACGQTKPITCGGIIFSMLAARHAVLTASEALEKNRFNERFLSTYEKRWMSDFGKEIKKQMLFRRIYRRMSNKDIDDFFRAFGSHAEKLNSFDYDRLSGLWKKMPKIRLAGFALKNARHMI